MRLSTLIIGLVVLLFGTAAFGYDNHGYPYTQFSGCMTTGVAKADTRGFYQNNCTSYSSYMLNVYGIPFSNGYRGSHWSHGSTWDDAARNVSGPNIPIDNSPLPGDIAYWNNVNGVLCELEYCGHVAWVEKVHFANGVPTSVDLTEYNYGSPCNFGQRTNVPVNGPDGYIHILAFNEGVKSTHYLDCYEMGNICANQTQQEWQLILAKVDSYRCTTCGGEYQEIANAFYANGGFGGSEASGPIPITGGMNSGSLPNLITNNSDIEDASRQKVTTLHINEPGHCRMQSKNIGTAAAGFFESRCYISDGSKIDNNPRDEGKEDTQGLGVGETHTEHEDFIAPEYPGIYNAVWCVDSDEGITESNEGDNCHAEDIFTVWSNPDIVTSSVVLGGGKTDLTPNEAFSIDTVITNAGENFGKTILVGYYLDNVLIGTDQIKRENLKGGVSKTETLSKAIAPATVGLHTLRVCADLNNRVQETNENNNCLSVSVQVVNPQSMPNPSFKKTNPAVRKMLLD